jgi:hypothetical protein
MARKRHWLVGGVLLVVMPLVICVMVVYSRGIERGRSATLVIDLRDRRLHTGMTREQVAKAIGTDSKKRCSYGFGKGYGLADMHFIGSSDRNIAALLSLQYREEADGTLVLEEISGPVDESMLPEHMDCPSDTPVAITPTAAPVRPTATD